MENIETNIKQESDTKALDTGGFNELNLNEDVIKGVYLYGFTQPSKIQIKGIKAISTGKDCILQSQSGTGKTATYLLGVLNRLTPNKTTQGIIITPTRELCEQVFTVAQELSKFTNYSIVKCVGGTNIYQNIKQLRTATVIIGTLGRINHMINDKKINIHNIKFIVLDEADELLVDGTPKELLELFENSPNGVQVILISATISKNVFNSSNKFIHDPIKVLLRNDEIAVNLISQFYIDVETEEYKFDTLLDLYNLVSTSQTIIFCNTIRKIEWLEENLKKNNFPITVIHSNMTQQERDIVVKEFREGKTRLLLTTDLLSRGIDIPQVNMVINYDLPINKETYIHRIGRCGRFDKKGVSITLVRMKDPSDSKTLFRMKQFYKIQIKEMPSDLNHYL
jgi:superfamily II DNA/RNA helicase